MHEPQIKKRTLWVLEDDAGCVFVYQQTLDHRFEMRYFERLTDFAAAFKNARETKAALPSLVVADLMLSDGNFLDFLMGAEGDHFNAPFVIVSSDDDIDSLRSCFKEGALDYLTKPFKKNELLVKIENVLAGIAAKSQLESGLDKVVHIEGVEVSGLTAKRMQLINLFLETPSRTVTRDNILDRVWGQTNVHPKTIDVHLYNLRRKLHGYGFMIRSDGGGRWSLLPDRYDFKAR